jgi:hypothetical protein
MSLLRTADISPFGQRFFSACAECTLREGLPVGNCLSLSAGETARTQAHHRKEREPRWRFATSEAGRTDYYANRVDVELTIEGMALTL